MTRPILAEYVRAGFALVPIPRNAKSPVVDGWNLRENAITDPDVAAELDDNIGLCHAYSGTCCVDLDDLEVAREWFAQHSIDIDAHLNAADAVKFLSGRPNRAKLLYRIDKPVQSFKLPGFELRCASSKGTTLQDVLPPSVHPDTGKEYYWELGPAGEWSDPPALPDDLRALWLSLIPKKVDAPKRETVAPPAKLAEILARQDPSEDYNAWVKVGMMLHHETQGSDAGLAMWDQWSAQAKDLYKGVDDLVPHWKSFGSVQNPVTADSFRDTKPASADEFAVVEEDAQPIVVAKRPGPVVSAETREKLQLVKRDKAGKAVATLSNLSVIMALPEVADAAFAYDSFKDSSMLSEAPEEWRPLRDTDFTMFRLWLESTAHFHPVPKELIRDAIDLICQDNVMDSAQKWLNSLQWDGVRRVESFMPKYFGTIDAKYERSVGVYLWTALAGRVMSPGCQADMVPIIVGSQGVGKTQGIKAMVPDPDFYLEVRLDETDDQIARKLRGVLIGELAELRGLRTGDIERIKAFVTRTHEKWTPKYKEFPVTFARRLVMVGTTNEDEFLGDTEERRWLPVRTNGVDVPAIRRDCLQLWAEAALLWRAHGIVWNAPQELAKDVHEEFKIHDPWTDTVKEWAQANPEVTSVRLQFVLTDVIGLDSRKVGKIEQNRVAKSMRALGWVNRVVRDKYGSTRVWQREAPQVNAWD